MKIKSFVVQVEHLDETTLGYTTKIKKVLSSEFYDGYSGDRMCRMVCEVK